MTDPLDILLDLQEKKSAKFNSTTFWSRNKKLILVIVTILVLLWVLALNYVNYWLPKIIV